MMSSPRAMRRELANSTRTLVTGFIVWKLLLFALASVSPGIGYDTSTSLLLNDVNQLPAKRNGLAGARDSAHGPILRIVRWDAIYFVKTAERGHLYEQEWAFSWALARFISFVAHYVFPRGDSLEADAVAGVVVAHVAHLLSVLALHRLALLLKAPSDSGKVAFVAAFLHIISPAGLFLSAPYSEAPFSCLAFLGTLLYARGLKSRFFQGSVFQESLSIVGAGICFGLSTLLRSNGLLYGILFAYDLLSILQTSIHDGISFRKFIQAGSTVFGGLLVAVGLVIPQWVAYNDFCMGDELQSRRPWCGRTVPSIYTWVQDHYWNVGFLRYWTFSNAPLFALAAPTLIILIRTGLSVLMRDQVLLSSPSRKEGETVEEKRLAEFRTGFLQRVALPQVVLAGLALTSFHVQVITRLASGYPLWYIVCATWLCTSTLSKSTTSTAVAPKSIIRWMVMYAVIQGGLYASFLPPA